ncbi:MAG: ATP-dependent DNA helicase RecG, partial [Tomitella sp.]|nr:ATP-dependent DNA helicase RecG [Tomitella sp.]
ILQATATPIPRTAAISTYGDLALSVLDEKPPGRTPTTTEWVDSADVTNSHSAAWAAVRKQVAQGRQAFVVCPLVKVSGKESETKMAAAAEETRDALESGALAGLRVGLATGKQKPDERSAVMAAFKDHDLDVLVATTVIEVGLSVPNATVMVILDPAKFGLAQLHQLRGRVGRGQWPGQCWLAGEASSEDGQERMAAMCETDDGFILAERDLQIRGPGALTGSAQAGRDAGLLVADLIDDAHIHLAAREDAGEILARDPQLLRSLTLKREVEAALGDDATYLTKS